MCSLQFAQGGRHTGMNFRNRYLVIVIRILLGLIMLASGISGLLMGNSTQGVPEQMVAFTQVFWATGIFQMVKVTEIVAGFMLVFGIFPALATRVVVGGATVAESTSPRLLFETGLPVRYYMPKTHVRMDLLTPTDSESHCPYKGQAEWWSVRVGEKVHKDLAWSYRTPLPESQKIAGLISFYNEKVDIYVDGVLQERPVTMFS